MTDLHVDDGTVQSAGIVGEWLLGAGLVIWGLTLGPVVAWARRLSARVTALEKRCTSCPAEIAMSRAVAIEAVRKELRGEIMDLRNHFDTSMDQQSAEFRAALDRIGDKIIAALGVKAARGEAD